MKLAILLTATVRPQVKGGNFTEAQRMEMYTSTLQYYTETVGKKHPIVVVENSDADLSPWKAKFKDTLRLEIIQFTPPRKRHNERKRHKLRAVWHKQGKGLQ